jgi:colanic acid/amylovoran biosynthesis glycosyltransferase
MNVAHMVATFPKSSETFILNQFIGIIERDVDIHILSMKKPDKTADHEIINEYNLLDRVTYTNAPKTYTKAIRTLAEVIPALLARGLSLNQVLSELRYGKSAPSRLVNMQTVHDHNTTYDICHAHFGTTANRFLSARDYLDCPLIASFYGADASREPRSNPAIYDELFTETSVVTCLSEDMKRDLATIGCPPNKTEVVPLCIDPKKFTYQQRTLESDEPVRIGTVARFVEKKGLEYAIEAVANLDAHGEIQYYIAGDGDRRQKLERLIKDLDANDRITLLGWRSQEEIAELMQHSHIFLLPSVTAANGDKEGTPTALLEAQSTGLPVVSTYHAGIPEIVEDGETGILVPERDTDALADALQTLIADPDRWSEMGKQGREYIEQNHSIEAVTDDVLELYRSLL